MIVRCYEDSQNEFLNQCKSVENSSAQPQARLGCRLSTSSDLEFHRVRDVIIRSFNIELLEKKITNLEEENKNLHEEASKVRISIFFRKFSKIDI